MTRIVGGRIGDPTRETVGQPVAIVLPDPTTLFARRADRLASLAGGHPMADWLRFMARVTRAQHDAVLALAPVNAVDMIEGIAPLATNGHQRNPDWREGLHLLLRALDDTTLPDQAGEALRQVQAQDPATLESLADGCLHGGLHQGQVGEALYVAAALSVYFARHAAALPAADVHMLAQRGRCPACGSAPVAGVITASGQAPGVRYLHCGLCATAWNHVRAVCTTCGGSRGVALLEIEGGDGAAQAETCDDCHSYAKMLYRKRCCISTLRRARKIGPPVVLEEGRQVMAVALESENAPTTNRTSMGNRRIEVITGRERRRRWSADQKREIAAESLQPGVSPVMVARRHGISSGLLYTWRQRLLCGALGAVADTKPRFVRVDVVAGPPQLEVATPAAPELAPPATPLVSPPAGPDGRIEIMLSGGAKVRVDAQVNEAALRRVLAALARS